MYPFVKQKLSDCQHGFRTRCSTITRLIAYIDKIYMDLDKGNTPIAVYFDFQKAFDKVPHHLLINKLRNFGFDEDYISLFKSYLQEIYQEVKVNGVWSSAIIVTSGVPQGSVLGRLLFVIFINDLPGTCLYSSCFIFADDSKLLNSDPNLLQVDMNNFIEWTKSNLMSLNENNCKLLLFSQRMEN